MFSAQYYSAAFLERRRSMEETNPTPEGKKLLSPTPRAPRIFADSGDIEEIRPLLEAGIINGVTTNPSLVKKAGAKDWDSAKAMMKEICDLLAPMPVSLELTEIEEDKMLAQAEELRQLGTNSVIKVPIGGFQVIDKSLNPHTGLRVLRKLWKQDIKTNATLIFNSTQAMWAAMAGATYVSPFLGRLADYAYQNDHHELEPGNSLYHVVHHREPEAVHNTAYVASGGDRKDTGIRLIQEIAQMFSMYDIKTEILAASFRNPVQLPEAFLAGCDIATVPAKILDGVADHPLTDAGFQVFYDDAQAFTK